ncbi:melanopsin [Biomphalaria pfeifferi]|uniref:Melanopsin n=1 Tax=Biomphalaria pfeifferi TaxID=112525 RepID=A0AAD8BAH9_BIOPF|nr:melanopsin [Biomphalaria pfeifferi]
MMCHCCGSRSPARLAMAHEQQFPHFLPDFRVADGVQDRVGRGGNFSQKIRKHGNQGRNHTLGSEEAQKRYGHVGCPSEAECANDKQGGDGSLDFRLCLYPVEQSDTAAPLERLELFLDLPDGDENPPVREYDQAKRYEEIESDKCQKVPQVRRAPVDIVESAGCPHSFKAIGAYACEW